MNRAKNVLRLAVICTALALFGGVTSASPRAISQPATRPAAQQTPTHGSAHDDWLKNEVRHQLVLLPYYSIFDNLEFSVDGSTVTLQGQVARASLKSDAENVVKKVEGVEKVVNSIEILPPSPMDDDIRRAEYRSIYGFPSLEKYAVSSVPSIHIVVKSGHVTLEGVVDNQADKDAANVRASTVPNVFSVTNNLRVVK